MTIDDEKANLRSAARKARAAAHSKHGHAADEAIARHGLSFANPAPGAIVSAFLPIRKEIDLQPLMTRLNEVEHPTALPVIEKKGQPLIFKKWSPGEQLQHVEWGIREPLQSATTVDPDIVLVPLLAFDNHGHRLGYGGGYYDRSIEKLRSLKQIVTIGIAFDEQKVDAVPTLDHDEPLDWMLTPSGPMRCKR